MKMLDDGCFWQMVAGYGFKCISRAMDTGPTLSGLVLFTTIVILVSFVSLLCYMGYSPGFAFVPYNNLTFIHYVLVILAATVKDWRPLNPIIFSSLFILSTLECLSLCISSQEINLPSSTWKTYERKTVTLIRHADTMLHKAIHF